MKIIPKKMGRQIVRFYYLGAKLSGSQIVRCKIVLSPSPYLVRNNTIDRFVSFIVTFCQWQCFDKLKYWVWERWIVTFANVRVWISLWLNWMCKATYWEGKLNGEILILRKALFRCASISWFQVVSKWVRDVFQLLHQRVLQSYFVKQRNWKTAHSKYDNFHWI